MTIEKHLDQTTLTIKIIGRLDTATAPSFETEVDHGLSGVEELILDCTGLEYLSSAGLRVLLKAQKRMTTQGTMQLIHVNEDIMDIFDVTGFSDVLTIV